MTWYNDLETDAKKAVGNWEEQPYPCFGLGLIENICNPKTQVVVYYETFDGLDNEKTTLDRANEKAIINELSPYIDCENPTVKVYPVNGENVLIVTALDESGDETPVWRVLCELAAALCDYPILDDELYHQYESEAADEYINNLMSEKLAIDDLRAGLEAGFAAHEGFYRLVEEDVIDNGLETWWDMLDSDIQERAVAIIARDSHELIEEKLNIEKVVAESIPFMSRSSLETLQTLIDRALQLKIVNGGKK